MKVDEIVARIRAEIRSREAKSAKPPRALRYRRGLGKFPTLREEEDLARLNRSWLLEPLAPISSHRPVVGRAIVAAKTRLQRAVAGVLQGYFAQEREFLGSLVRVLNRIVEHLDELAKTAHVDDELLVGRTEVFLARAREDELALETRVERLREAVAGLRATSVSRAAPDGGSGDVDVAVGAPSPDDEESRARFAIYVPALVGHAPVLHLPAGYGDLVAALAAAGVSAAGREPDPGAAAAARERGVAVENGRLSFGGVAPGSLGAIVLTDAERLPPGELHRLVREAIPYLRPGGIVLVETPNPRSFGGVSRLATAGGRGAIAIERLIELVEQTGFVDVRADLTALAPPPLELPDVELLSPTLRGYAENFRRLNETLFAPAWQLVIGRRPGA